MYAQVILTRPTHRRPPTGSDPLREDRSWQATYTYYLPDPLSEQAEIGHLVQVPLQKGSTLGVIAELAYLRPPDLSPELEIREVTAILDPLPVVTQGQIDLARWIARTYLAPLSQAMRLMLPPNLEARTFVLVTPTVKNAPADLSEEERKALHLLQSRGSRMRLSALLDQLQVDDAEAVLDSLSDRGLVDTRHAMIPPKPAPPRIQYARLLADGAAIEKALPRLGRPSKQADALLVLARRDPELLTVAELAQAAGCTEGPIRALAQRGWIEITERRTLVVAAPGVTLDALSKLHRAPKQAKILKTVLRRGSPIELSQLLAETDGSTTQVASLEKRELVQRIVEEPLALLTLPKEQILDQVITLRGAHKQAGVLEALRGTTDRVWVGGLYAETGADLITLKELAGRGLISLHADEYPRPHFAGPEAPPSLTPDQSEVWEQVEAGLRYAPDAESGARPYVALLHGVTGSGKTEIYLRALASVLAQGRRAIVLVPEISLTAQTVRRFENRFPGRVTVLHSQLSLGQRYAAWDRLRRGEADIVVGPRSALLTPISRLGLIVLDEAHDDSYKQSEPIPLPAYHTREAARALGQIAGAALLMGSATPDVVTYHRAVQGEFHLLTLPHRIRTGSATAPPAVQTPYEDHPLPPVRVVDLRQELRAGNRSVFSRALQEALDQTLRAGEQAILFLNRRGAATFVLCRNCGYVARCPHCDIPLTLHRASGRPKASAPEQLICHHCNYHQEVPTRCPECQSPQIRFFGLGTERVEAAVQEIYPQARLLRWDRDTASGSDHERFLQTFIDHRADVLIGTQMIAKGLDLPLVTLVGVISADTALYLPDYRAAERTFQLLTQVAGRAGRSHHGGRVIVQTYNPDHYAIRAAAHHDFASFYRQESTHRRLLGYPPFSRLVALRFSDPDLRTCQRESQRLGRWLSQEIERQGIEATLIGPAPCFFSRLEGRYRWQILIRGPEPAALLRDVALPRGWLLDVDPVTTL